MFSCHEVGALEDRKVYTVFWPFREYHDTNREQEHEQTNAEMSDVPCSCCCSFCLLDGECHHAKTVGRDLVDPFCTCDCFQCRFIARSWINVIERAGYIANTSITNHLPPQDISEKDRWKAIEDYAYGYAEMIGLRERWLDVLAYMEMKMKDQIKEDRN